MMEEYIKTLTDLAMSEHPNLGPGDSVLSLLYEVYNERNNMDTDRIKTAFQALYRTMNGKTLEEMDTILYPVCALCREHQRSGFIAGVKIGLKLAAELA